MAQLRKHKTPPDPRKAHGPLRATLRKRVFAAQSHCGICGREVDQSLPAHNPLSPELDEIIPIARGGSPYDIDNLQIAHRVCNRKKGAKLQGEGEIHNPTPVSRAW
jgi:5-methylcytosine-specific restriction endonuclease McrA